MCATHTASDFRKLRHRWEMPLIWVSIGVTVLAVIAGVWIMMLDEADAMPSGSDQRRCPRSGKCIRS